MAKLIHFLVSFLLWNNVHAQPTVYTVAKKSVQSIQLRYDGVLVPGKMSEIIAPITARVIQQHFEFGDHIEFGQLLFELDPKEIEMALITAKTQLLEQHQQIEKLSNWQASSEVVNANFNLNRELKQYEYAKEHFKQSEKLYEAGIIARDEYLRDQRQYEESVHHYQNAAKIRDEMIKKGDPQYLKLAQMKENQLKEEIERIEQQCRCAKMNAPVSGTILAPHEKESSLLIQSKKYHTGQIMALIADMEHPYIEFKVDELDVVKIKKGQKAYVSFYAFPKYKLKAEIQEITISPSLKESSPSRFLIKVKINEIPQIMQNKLMLGFTANVILQPHILEGLFLPKEAVLHQENKSFVTLLKNNKAVQQVIEISEITEDEVLIASGLTLGDQIVLPG